MTRGAGGERISFGVVVRTGQSMRSAYRAGAGRRGVYIPSESRFSRVLRAHGQSCHRGRAKAAQRRRPTTTHIATAPPQVWCWDMTFLPAGVLGGWFYPCLTLELYSRKIVGWEVHESDSSDYAVNRNR
jgi:putative transposase